MSEITPQAVAAWHRNIANKHLEMAHLIEQGLGLGMTRYPRKDQPITGERNGTVTKEQFEAAVKAKSGRVKDFADRFRVTESVINDFLKQPDSKVYAAERGWLKVKP